MKTILVYFVFLFSTTRLLSQSCSISVDALKGQYIGDCKKGKAAGKGTAIGIDSYTGDFKNGYPDGQGKYTWKNGNWYEGFWKDGLFEGQGTLSKISKPDSVVLTGIWKKGKYVGRYEKPYIVHSITNSINDVNIRKLNNTVSEITITVKSITGGGLSPGLNPIISNPVLPKPRLINILPIGGRFEQQVTDETSSTVTNKYIFRKVTFPFYAILSFQAIGTKLQEEKVVIEIFENGGWYVQVSINN